MENYFTLLDKTLQSEVELEQCRPDGQGVVDVIVGRVLHKDDGLQLITGRLNDLTRHVG